MSLLAPAALFLAALLPVIILLYLLKLRRTDRPVASTYLWRQMVRDVEANAPWQRLKFNLLMLLQLLFLALLIFALARPATRAQGIASSSAILIIDTSASMAAVDVAPSRLEAAKDQAQRIVNDLPDGAQITLIAAGASARVAVSQTTDTRQVQQAIDALQPQPGGSDMGVALQLASAIAARRPDTQVVVLSDGRVSLPERAAVQGVLTYMPIGMRSDNQAISLLNLEPDPEGSLAAFAQVTNYGEIPVRRRIAFYADGVLADAFDLELPPGGEQAVIARGIDPVTQIVEARLAAAGDTADYFSWDDQAQAVNQPAETISVTLVSPGNLFVETALALMPAVQVTRLNPGGSSPLPDADLTILDGQAPISGTLPVGGLLYLGPLATTEFFTVTGRLNNPRPLPALDGDPLLRFVELDTVGILTAAAIPLPEWARAVIVADDPSAPLSAQPPLLFAGEPGGRRVAVLAFDLRHSDLPLQVAFPILFSHLVDWLAPGRSGALPQTVAPGEVLALSAIGGVENPGLVRLQRPDGSQVELSADASRLTTAETNHLGLYRLSFADGRLAAYAVNLFSPLESAIAPADALAVAGVVENGGGLAQKAQREWWRLLALLALLLLFIEWLVYHRPAIARLRTAIRPRRETVGRR